MSALKLERRTSPERSILVAASRALLGTWLLLSCHGINVCRSLSSTSFVYEVAGSADHAGDGGGAQVGGGGGGLGDGGPVDHEPRVP